VEIGHGLLRGRPPAGTDHYSSAVAIFLRRDGARNNLSVALRSLSGLRIPQGAPPALLAEAPVVLLRAGPVSRFTNPLSPPGWSFPRTWQNRFVPLDNRRTLENGKLGESRGRKVAGLTPGNGAGWPDYRKEPSMT